MLLKIMTQKQQITEKILPDYPPDFVANTIEIHDQLGILIKIVNQKITTQSSRKKYHVPKFICWYINGKKAEDIACMHTNKSILVDRISQIDTKNLIKKDITNE